MATFGCNLRPDFFLESQYIPLNHGSFGAYPRALRPLLHYFQEKAETHPDRWLRREMFPVLQENREAVANMIHCDPEELAFIMNASYGMNTVLRSIPMKEGDKILCFSTAYNAVDRLLAYIQDSRKAKLVQLELIYPLSDQQILDMTREAIEREGPESFKLGVFDAISSVPGVRFPFEKMCKLLKEYNILSLVDGAHAIGQIPLDLHAVDPDFFTTNCHKWLFAPRGTALLYVPKRNQRLIHPAIINVSYKDHRDLEDQRSSYQDEFSWPGTIDFSSYMCVKQALKYRDSLGGEDKIQTYCNDLARKGGQIAANILGTDVLENDEKNLTLHMVNVRLPLQNTTLTDSQITNHFYDKLMYEHNTMASPYKHNNKWYARLSAQVYLGEEDFEHAAKALLSVCSDLNKQ